MLLALQIAAILVPLYLLFHHVLVDMAKDWWNFDAYSQGMLLPPLALYIAWLQRDRILSCPAATDTRGLLVIAAACGTYLLGSVASEFFMMRFSFVILLAGLIWTFWGIERLRRLTFPLLLLAAMVPLPVLIYNSLAAPLQLLASDVAANLVQHLGISLFRDGNILQLANITLGVAEACSGLNSLAAMVVGSLLIGYLFCSGLLSRTVLVLSAVPLAIVINIFRVVGTAILADSNEEYAMGFYHSFSGWLVFVGGCGILYMVALLLHKLLDRNPV